MRTICIFLTLLLTGVSTSFAQTTSSPTVSYVYLGSRTAHPHTITAFSIQADGSAHQVPGSPFSAAALTGNSKQTILAASKNFVYASDSENIVTFRRGRNGALTFASSVVAAPQVATIDSLTLDRTASNLYAGGGRFGDGQYFVFDKGAQGQLTAASTLTGAQSDGELEFNHSDQFAYTTYLAFLSFPEFNGQQCSFEAYRRETDGSLNPFYPQLTAPLGVMQSAFCPASAASSALGYLAVAYRTPSGNQESGVHSIAVYKILSSGELQLVSNVVTNLNAALPAALRFDPSGTFLAAMAFNGIQLYKLSSAGVLTTSGPQLYLNTHFRDAQWDNSGHIITVSFGAVYFFALKKGQLVETNLPQSTGQSDIRDFKVVSLQ